MAQYSRQFNMDTETMEDTQERALSPTCEVLSDGARTVFISPSLTYRVRYTSLWKGRSGLEKVLLLLVIFLLCLCCSCLVVIFVTKQERCTNIRLLHPDAKFCDQDGNDKDNITRPKNDSPNKSIDVEDSSICLTTDCIQVSAEIIKSADFSQDPCEDFYEYACGGWMDANPIPDGKSSWNTFKKLWQNNQNTLRKLLERNSTEKDSSCRACQKARTYYTSCVDPEGKLEKLEGKPLLDLLSQFYWNITDFDGGAQLDRWDLQNVTEYLQHNFNIGGFFIWNVGEDDKNSSRHVIQLDQGGLTLSTREQYINKSVEDDPVLSALLQVMVQTSLMLYKEKKNISSTEEISEIIRDDITRQMKDIIDFETELAKVTIPATQQRDGEERYNNFTLELLQKHVDFFDWTMYFSNVFKQINRTVSKKEPIIVYSFEYLTSLNAIIKEKLKSTEGLNLMNNYLIWQLMKNFNMALSKQYREVDQILQRALTGANIREERWRECITDVDNVLGFAIGAQFVNQTFDNGTKPQAEKMIKLITEAFKEGLVEADWMDNETRVEAERKAEKITNMIGFPDYIINNTALEQKYENLVVSEDYFDNNLHFNRWVLLENLKKLDKKVETNKWGMTPSTINAYYTPLKNQIVFPAGILQAPFFSLNRPQSLNYGAMGVVMGHELSHAFDDQGRQYDGSGNMRNWWRNDTLLAYKDRIKCIETEYGNLTTESGEHINGLQTLGENIADNGGLKAAFRAFKSLKDEDKTWKSGKLPGLNLTDNQLFFLSFAQVWCDISTPESEHLSAMEDAHSPPRGFGLLAL